jgi:uncharacterized protein YfdQ (DUF2303 family)
MEPSDMQAVIEAAQRGVTGTVLFEQDGIKYVSLQFNGATKIEGIKVRDHAAVPFRKSGIVLVFDIESLNKLLAENDDAGATTVYINRDAIKPAIVAVLNGAGKTGPGWGDFRASISFRPTSQWSKWAGIDGKFLSQADFANFIEDNLLDVVDPAPADMLEISQFMEVTRTTSFKSVTRLSTGLVQFRNEANDVAAEHIKVPETLTLSVAPMIGFGAIEVKARFRYRIENNTLKLGIKLQRVEDIMDGILNGMVEGIVLPPGAVMVEGVAP